MTVDRTLLRVEGIEEGISYPWNEHFVFDDGSWSGAITTGTREMVQEEIIERLSGTVQRVAPYKTGEIVVGSGGGAERDTVVAGWRGRYHSVMTHLNPDQGDLGGAIRVFSRFLLVDQRDGVILVDGAEKSAMLRRRCLTTSLRDKEILIEVQRSVDVAEHLPDAAGLKVRGGELWRQDYNELGSHQVDLFLLSEDALTTVSMDLTAGKEFREGLAITKRLRVKWAA